MSSGPPVADVDGMVSGLRERWGDSVRSVVEYSPQSSTIHYLRDDIDERNAEGRLARIEELYHSERLSVFPPDDDPGFGSLFASVYFFDGAVVVHVVEPAGVVYGVSFGHDLGTSLAVAVRDCLETLYGEIPDRFDGTALATPNGTDSS